MKQYRKAWNGGVVPTQRYVVAVNLQEAEMLVDEIGHATRAEAEQHLAEIKALPTDPAYAQQYKIYVLPASTTTPEATRQEPT